MVKCQGTTKVGKACQSSPMKGEEYCKRHIMQKEQEATRAKWKTEEFNKSKSEGFQRARGNRAIELKTKLWQSLKVLEGINENISSFTDDRIIEIGKEIDNAAAYVNTLGIKMTL